jgi:hypothetical protein
MIKTFWLNRFLRVFIKQINLNCLFPTNNLLLVSPNPAQEIKEHLKIPEHGITNPSYANISTVKTYTSRQENIMGFISVSINNNSQVL